jgi:ribosomal protein S18 acetylase RimI-like enzyme
MILVREISADDWELMREVRLAALSEAPHAFASTYGREAAFTEETWRGRINKRSTTFFAYADPAASVGTDGRPAGLAGVYVELEDADLVSMWVRPSARGTGVGEALVAAAVGWARANNYPTLFLWVAETNQAARRLYQRCGFTATGEQQPLPSNPAVQEIRMSRAL